MEHILIQRLWEITKRHTAEYLQSNTGIAIPLEEFGRDQDLSWHYPSQCPAYTCWLVPRTAFLPDTTHGQVRGNSCTVDTGSILASRLHFLMKIKRIITTSSEQVLAYKKDGRIWLRHSNSAGPGRFNFNTQKEHQGHGLQFQRGSLHSLGRERPILSTGF